MSDLSSSRWAVAAQSACEATALSADDTAQNAATVEVAALEKQVERGASWFYWIAGLSLVNSILSLTDSGWMFFFGLGITQTSESSE